VNELFFSVTAGFPAATRAKARIAPPAAVFSVTSGFPVFDARRAAA
jgi:hypothetical protein